MAQTSHGWRPDGRQESFHEEMKESIPSGDHFERQKPAPVAEYRNPETIKGSALLSSLRSKPASFKQEDTCSKKINKVASFTNFQTFPGPNARTKVTVDSQMGVGKNSVQWVSRTNNPAQPGINNGITVKSNEETQSSGTKKKFDKSMEELPKVNNRGPGVGRSVSNRETRVPSVFKNGKPEISNQQKFFIPKEPVNDFKSPTKPSEPPRSPPQNLSLESPTSPKGIKDSPKSSEEEEPQLTTKQITGILERKLKFRLHPPGTDTHASKTSTAQTPNSREDCQVGFTNHMEENPPRPNSGENNSSNSNAPNIGDYPATKNDGILHYPKRDGDITGQEQLSYGYNPNSVTKKGHTRELSQMFDQQLSEGPTQSIKTQATVNLKKFSSFDAPEQSGMPAPKLRISFPPDDQLAVTHDYEAEPIATKADTDSDGSGSEDDATNANWPKGNVSSADETEDSTDSMAAKTPFLHRHRKSFPRPKWSTKDNNVCYETDTEQTPSSMISDQQLQEDKSIASIDQVDEAAYILQRYALLTGIDLQDELTCLRNKLEELRKNESQRKHTTHRDYPIGHITTPIIIQQQDSTLPDGFSLTETGDTESSIQTCSTDSGYWYA
ncbi:unnamed protein product [Echinostoma caproni]|uniref:FYN-binding protein 1 n=1 Tax=Echinostoma caproni TaxID=27848 RepID=A0A183A7Q1_9TREM|nr:unnamed protein product [Echinostoma caproni]